LLSVLTRFGRADLACKILLQEDYPSWLYTVRIQAPLAGGLAFDRKHLLFHALEMGPRPSIVAKITRRPVLC
jgi:hypothetical protein